VVWEKRISQECREFVEAVAGGNRRALTGPAGQSVGCGPGRSTPFIAESFLPNSWSIPAPLEFLAVSGAFLLNGVCLISRHMSSFGYFGR